jgi:hypothetical protein
MKRLILAIILSVMVMMLCGPSALAEDPPPPEPNPNIYPPHVYVTLAPGEYAIIEKEVTVDPPNPGVNPIPPVSGTFKVKPEIYLEAPPIEITFDPPDAKEVVDLTGSFRPVITFIEKIFTPPETHTGEYEITVVFPVTQGNGYSENLGKQVVHVTVIASTPGTRTLGFYKNHPCVIEQVMPPDGINLGNLTVENTESAVRIIKNRKNPEARLRSQLLTTKLNDLVFNIANLSLESLGIDKPGTVKNIMKIAYDILAQGNAGKDKMSKVQDLLDEINNSCDDTPLPEWISDACD